MKKTMMKVNEMRSKFVFWSILIAIASVNMVANAAIYDLTYTSTIDLSYIAESDSANVSVSFRYDTNATPEQLQTGDGFARYWVDGEFTIEDYTVEFTDALIIVANDRIGILEGDAFGVTNLISGTTITGQIFGYDVYAFAFGLRDSDFSSLNNLKPPEGNDVLDNFDWNRNSLWLDGVPHIETTHVPYTVNAVLVPELTNSPPVADAGNDQIVYLCADGTAEVELDGSGSADADGDEFDYLWTWEIEGMLFDANGVSPIIELPVGLHTINLTVDDGVEVSEPNSCVIEVIASIEVDLRVLPRVINRKSRMKRILAVVQLPADIDGDDIDGSFLLYPGGIEPRFSRLMTVNGSQKLFMSFDKPELMAAVPGNGAVVLEIQARLISGRCLYGSDRIKIIRRGQGPKEQTGRRKSELKVTGPLGNSKNKITAQSAPMVYDRKHAASY